MEKIHVLLVEDERRMAEARAKLFQREQYDVTVCLKGISGEVSPKE